MSLDKVRECWHSIVALLTLTNSIPDANNFDGNIKSRHTSPLELMSISWIHGTRFVFEWFIWVFRLIVRVMPMLDISEDFSEIWQTVFGQHADTVNQPGYSTCGEAGQS
jgi:hypothetical protein